MSHNRIVVLEDEEIALVVPEMSDLEVMTRGINHLDNAKYIVPDLPRGVMGYKLKRSFGMRGYPSLRNIALGLCSRILRERLLLVHLD
ncbi:MAG: hypothetical protein U0518_06025 [Candidatus Gracilibacteria bacterium]